jgi:hypothetical protein
LTGECKERNELPIVGLHCNFYVDPNDSKTMLEALIAAFSSLLVEPIRNIFSSRARRREVLEGAVAKFLQEASEASRLAAEAVRVYETSNPEKYEVLERLSVDLGSHCVAASSAFDDLRLRAPIQLISAASGLSGQVNAWRIKAKMIVGGSVHPVNLATMTSSINFTMKDLDGFAKLAREYLQ